MENGKATTNITEPTTVAAKLTGLTNNASAIISASSMSLAMAGAALVIRAKITKNAINFLFIKESSSDIQFLLSAKSIIKINLRCQGNLRGQDFLDRQGCLLYTYFLKKQVL